MRWSQTAFLQPRGNEIKPEDRRAAPSSSGWIRSDLIRAAQARTVIMPGHRSIPATGALYSGVRGSILARQLSQR